MLVNRVVGFNAAKLERPTDPWLANFKKLNAKTQSNTLKFRGSDRTIGSVRTRDHSRLQPPSLNVHPLSCHSTLISTKDSLWFDIERSEADSSTAVLPSNPYDDLQINLAFLDQLLD